MKRSINTAGNILVLACLLIGGCMLGPNYERPVTEAETGRFQNASVLQSDPNQLLSGRWWRQFQDSITDELVIQALAGNTDLKAAAAGVLEAEYTLAIAQGARWPQVDYGFVRSRDKLSFNLPPPTGRVSFYTTSYQQNLSISYMTDLFGKLRRSERAALDDLLAAEASRRALQQAIIAEVIRTRISISTQLRLLEIADANIQNWTRALEIIDGRYRQGLVSPLDVYLAKENLANAKAAKTALEQTLAVTYHALDVLLGRRPAATTSLDRLPSELPPMESVPVGLPAQLLDRRPDLQAAEMQLAAATERVGVNIAALFPDLTLTASGGYASDSFRYVTATENQVYSAVMSIAQPIFHGGRLRAAVDAAKARTQQAAANYAGAVLTAMREVEDALVREQKIRQRILELSDRFTQARQAEQLAGQRYVQGIDSILIVLETERSRRAAENELAVAQGNLWNARVDLMLALGGDWGMDEMNNPAKPEKTSQSKPAENQNTAG